MNCKKCGELLPVGSISCPNCGEPVSNIKSIDEIQNTTNEPIFSEKKKEKKENSEEPVINDSDLESNNKKNIIISVGVIAAIIIVFVIIIYSTLKPIINPDTPKVSETGVIGNDKIGYITLNDSWDRADDGSNSEFVAYKRADTWTLIIDSFDSNQDVEDFAQSFYENKLNDETFDSVAIEETNVAGYGGYQVTSYYTVDDKWISEWFFEDNEGRMHYLSVEGPDSESEYFSLPTTFTLKKK